MTEKLLLIENLKYLVVVSNFLFVGGVLGTLVARSSVIWLVCIELIFVSSFLNFISFSIFYLNLEGFIYALLVLIFAAVESALGLSLIAVNSSRKKRSSLNFYRDISNQ